MINRKLLVSSADFFSNDVPINPYYKDERIDLEKAKAEHALIVSCFREAGIEVVQVPAPADSQDGIYTANWGLVRDGRAVMARLPAARKAEEPYAREVLTGMGVECIDVPDDSWYSGQGDSLPCGKYLFGGSAYRSDHAAQKFAAETLGLELVQLQTIPKIGEDGSEYINPNTGRPDSFFYDCDLAISVIDDGVIAYCPEAFVPESQRILAELPIEKIIVDYDEAVNGFACNLVSTGSVVVMSARAPKLQKALEDRGLRTITPEVSEIAKGGGYIRCISLAI